MTYTDAVINNKSAQSRALSADKKKSLIALVFIKTGYSAPQDTSIKLLKEMLK